MKENTTVRRRWRSCKRKAPFIIENRPSQAKSSALPSSATKPDPVAEGPSREFRTWADFYWSHKLEEVS